MSPEKLDEWMAEYTIRGWEYEENRLAAKAEAGLPAVKRGLR